MASAYASSVLVTTADASPLPGRQHGGAFCSLECLKSKHGCPISTLCSSPHSCGTFADTHLPILDPKNGMTSSRTSSVAEKTAAADVTDVERDDPDAEFGGHEARKVMERKLLRKLDLRMSILIVIYILNYVSNCLLLLCRMLTVYPQVDRNNAGYGIFC